MLPKIVLPLAHLLESPLRNIHNLICWNNTHRIGKWSTIPDKKPENEGTEPH